MPPSVADFNSCYDNGYKMGIVACHNGKVFAYTSHQKISEELYNMYVGQFLTEGKSEFDSQLLALKELRRSYDINFKEVT